MSDLLVHPAARPAPDGTILRVTPASAGWSYVGFEVLALGAGRRGGAGRGRRECCVVVISGTVAVVSGPEEWGDVGGRADPWSGRPDAVYLPPASHFELQATGGGAEVALCWAPGPEGGRPAARLPGEEITVETRGYGARSGPSARS